MAEMNDIAPEIRLSIRWPRFLAIEAGFPWYPTGRPKKDMYAKKIGRAATMPRGIRRGRMGICRQNRKRAAADAAVTAPPAADRGFIHATPAASVGRRRLARAQAL